MNVISVTNARSQLYKLLDEVALSSQPVHITGKRNDAVLVSKEDWDAIEETLYLLSIPGMRESLIEGYNTPLEECDDDPGW